jgi:hypothetical protein
MTALVAQTPGDLDDVDRVAVAHSDDYLLDIDWTTAFEFGGDR